MVCGSWYAVRGGWGCRKLPRRGAKSHDIGQAAAVDGVVFAKWRGAPSNNAPAHAPNKHGTSIDHSSSRGRAPDPFYSGRRRRKTTRDDAHRTAVQGEPRKVIIGTPDGQRLSANGLLAALDILQKQNVWPRPVSKVQSSDPPHPRPTLHSPIALPAPAALVALSTAITLLSIACPLPSPPSAPDVRLVTGPLLAFLCSVVTPLSARLLPRLLVTRHPAPPTACCIRTWSSTRQPTWMLTFVSARRYIHTVPWMHTPGSSGTVTPSRLRSLSPLPPKQVTKSISSPHLGKMESPLPTFLRTDSELNTIPDPRSPSPQPALSRNNSNESSVHPDLSQEVATLSTKLINAINHQTTLDDSLQQTRHELETAKEKLAIFENRVRQHEEMVAKGLLVEKVVYDKMEKQLVADLEDERRRRVEAEKSKRKTDAEVEQLTSALFEEANTMVSAARKETEASEKRNEQLKQQLKDAEVLQTNFQEQLHDLKLVMEKMSSDRDGSESTNLATTTAPSTPGLVPADKMTKLFEAANLTPHTPGSEEMTPEPPLHFAHLIHPVLRSDLQTVKDFQEMLRVPNRASAPSSRASSGNYGSLNVLGLGSLTNNSTTSLPASTRSPSSAGNNSPRDSIAGLGMANLKDEKFYKRSLVEDIEPTLRLDIAPGLSWMARRTVLNAITAGSLVVEPHPPVPKFRGPIFPCSLCGESRIGEDYVRKFRFKTSEADDSQKYPLCDWCLSRVRTSCDYIGFLRMVVAGHWRAETEDEKKTAWEESVRLRERMFWTRLGGGVVPAFVSMRDSPRSPIFANGVSKVDELRKSEESQLSDGKALDSAVDMSEVSKGGRKSEEDPFRTAGAEQVKRVSIGKTVISTESSSSATLTQDEEKTMEQQAEEQLQNEVLKAMEAKMAETEKEQEVKQQKQQEAQLEQQKLQEVPAEPQTADDVQPTLQTIEEVQPELAKAEEVQPEQVKVEEVQPEQQKAEVVQTEQLKAEEVQLKHSRSISTPLLNFAPRKKDERLSLTIPGAFDS
ncbi:hypothetical protein P154DRAFT_538506 [Amniculicola lignicola CBS 123094]|uniref:GDP/GTP exchange factor Sec2 N-terminal domain-containing protein n=1 Tax=Amniculicola lignicola CBS 123094 TaxID=1392246 RepID=A0A6A5W3L5_9PLEO|nr:hypothetical protein P154DRAFT_538506 [Amniculicola lignicola CBS 123094]